MHSISNPCKGGCWPLALWLLGRAAAAASVDAVAVAAAQSFAAAIHVFWFYGSGFRVWGFRVKGRGFRAYMVF